MSSITIGDALFTKTQQRVIGLLFSRPDRSFYTNEIMWLASVGRGTVSRELSRLVDAGLLRVKREGNQQNTIFHELSGIVKKTFAVGDVIRDAMLPLKGRIAYLFPLESSNNCRYLGLKKMMCFRGGVKYNYEYQKAPPI